MKLKTIGSGSSGNCYLLTDSQGHTLIIEAGLKMAQIKQALDWKLGSVDGCIVTHEHNDHALAVKDLLKCGIRVLMPESVMLKGNNYASSFAKEIQEGHGVKIGEFRVFPFLVEHDVPCFGFVISHKEMGKLLFVTDTMMLRQTFSRLDHILIECNYSDEQLQRNIDNGLVPAGMRDRLMMSHMELQTTKRTLKGLDLANVKEVVLIHLSGNNSEVGRMKQEVMATTGLPTYIAAAGLELELTK